MKAALVFAIGYSVCCPECGQPQSDATPRGTEIWDGESVRALAGAKSLRCGACGTVFRLPAALLALGWAAALQPVRGVDTFPRRTVE